MSITNELDIKASICDPRSDVNDANSCEQVVLKIPFSEVEKLYSLELSESDEHYSYFSEYEPAQIWSFGFGAVIFFYVTGLGVGAVLGAIKQFTRIT